MTNDHGVRDLLSFLLARDTMHQNMWQAAAAELQAEGAERLPALSNFPQKKEFTEVSYQCQSFSDGAAASEGSWAKGPRSMEMASHLPRRPHRPSQRRKGRGPRPGQARHRVTEDPLTPDAGRVPA